MDKRYSYLNIGKVREATESHLINKINMGDITHLSVGYSKDWSNQWTITIVYRSVLREIHVTRSSPDSFLKIASYPNIPDKFKLDFQYTYDAEETKAFIDGILYIIDRNISAIDALLDKGNMTAWDVSGISPISKAIKDKLIK